MKIFFMFIIISLINLIFSVHFISIMCVGIVFITFIRVLSEQNIYALFWIIITFLVIENAHGLQAFTLIGLALLIYIFIKPSIHNIFSSSTMLKSWYIIIFYMAMLLFYSLLNGFIASFVLIIIINLMLDLIVTGLFL